MRYKNATEVLPKEFIDMIQEYYQGGYLYIPRKTLREMKKDTDYKIELAKRNQHIYLKNLEGFSNKQLANTYHLSESSVRRIVSGERMKYLKMKEKIEQVLPLWRIESRQILQIYPSAWEVNSLYVMKVYQDRNQLERNIAISTKLLECNIPVAEIVATNSGDKYVECDGAYFFMTQKLLGSNRVEIRDAGLARQMGYAIAQLHNAFLECEKVVDFWDNSLLMEMQGWIKENLIADKWNIISEDEYANTTLQLEQVYKVLPRQLIHRDVHFGNFLFQEDKLSGYIDFDLSQRNIRIFDICYFLTGLLAEETEPPLTKNEWLEMVAAVIEGYEGLGAFTIQEKEAIPCVMKCIEILFVAYYIRMNDVKCAKDAKKVFLFIQECEGELKKVF